MLLEQPMRILAHKDYAPGFINNACADIWGPMTGFSPRVVQAVLTSPGSVSQDPDHNLHLAATPRQSASVADFVPLW
jgi:hypothetical protein